ncbi:hypothetical protein B0H16DRAFT_1711031 [Mycena metata]|uniref:Uncharacterized protein n=1 Tax=Mycena metata TaxID=1033252 RepID=A0AAD7K7F4_9AGAR|nr:hypothetical protein B0H16DRAFT_1711031 [Mycena metata]
MGCFPNDFFAEADVTLRRVESEDLAEEAAQPLNIARRTVKDLRIRRPIVTADWERLLLYSHRVRTLYLVNYIGAASASTSAFYDVCLALPGSHIFPNLWHLQIDLTSAYQDSQPARIIPFLLAPGIQKLAISLAHSDRASHFLLAIPQWCPSVTCLEISNWDDGDIQSGSALVQNLAQIRELYAHKLNQQAMEYLRRLPTLRTWSIEDPTVEFLIDDQDDEAHSYSSLTSLKFGHPRIERVTEFLKIVRNCSLQRLNIGSVEGETATAARMTTVFSTLAAQCSHTSLRTIRHQTRSFSNPDPTFYALTGRIIRPLFCFKNMVSVSICQPCGLDITNNDVLHLAAAWPFLEFLLLAGFDHVPSWVTLHALSVLARFFHCPFLPMQPLSPPCGRRFPVTHWNTPTDVFCGKA